VKYLSVCSGIESATCAWHSLGWKPEAFSEIEKFPCQVLAHHYPTVPNLGDMTKFKEWNLGTIDLLVGGTPCQSFSVAGLRKGLDDPRGNLMLTYLAIAEQFKPKWLVWENVPGVLSSNGGKDFGSLLGGLAELGYGFAYRILDAQYFGVAQRRRRVFVVGCLGDWRAAAAVLFERDSMCGNLAPKRQAGESIAKCLTRGTGQRYDSETDDFITYGIQANIIGRQDHNGGNGMGVSEGIAPTLTKADQHGVCVVPAIPINTMTVQGRPSDDLNPRMGLGIGEPGEPQNTLTKGHSHAVFYQSQVRRLTPRECERLQGFPDDYTLIPVGKKIAADSPRYKALGNSMAVPVMNWIGDRIQQVENILNAN